MTASTTTASQPGSPKSNGSVNSNAPSEFTFQALEDTNMEVLAQLAATAAIIRARTLGLVDLTDPATANYLIHELLPEAASGKYGERLAQQARRIWSAAWASFDY